MGRVLKQRGGVGANQAVLRRVCRQFRRHRLRGRRLLRRQGSAAGAKTASRVWAVNWGDGGRERVVACARA